MEIKRNVRVVMDDCWGIMGSEEKRNFHINLQSLFAEEGVSSPIEQIMYCALTTARFRAGFNRVKYRDIGAGISTEGIGIDCQFEVGKYRCDFQVFYLPRPTVDKPAEISPQAKKVIIECDSQAWHERTEGERQSEKKRDRFLQKKGYKVFRYTGSEILKSHHDIAEEIIEFLTT